jgi:hypothetical protein
MVTKILNFVKNSLKTAVKTAVQMSGPAALYLCAATTLAAILLGAYLKYAWNIDKNKFYKMLAVAQGLDIVQIEKAAEDRIAGMSYQEVLERRARRIREEEFNRDVTNQVTAYPLPPEEPKPELPPEPSAAERINAYEKRVKADLEKSRTAGLEEETRLLENMDPDQAKEVVRKLWKDGAMQRILQMLIAMEDKRRGEILYAMRQDNAEELKDLTEILQKIGDGEPTTSIINKAGAEQ